MRFEISCEIAAPVDRVWAWWTDYGEPGAAAFRVSHGMGSSRRTILARDAGSVVFEDASALGRIRRTVRIGPGWTLAETGEGGQRFESTWRFEPAGEGRTRVTREMRVRAGRVVAPFARWLARRDLAHHGRECERTFMSERRE